MRYMNSKSFAFRLFICISLMCFLFVSNAFTENNNLPDGLKKNYNYDTRDKSIIVVKQRLAELGYLQEEQAKNDWINNTLKKAVLQFQKDNGLKQDGKLDSDLFILLFAEPQVAANEVTENNGNVSKSVSVTEQTVNIVETEKNVKDDNRTETNNSDSNSKPNYISFLGVAVIIISLFVILAHKSNKKTKYVKAHSKRYAAIIGINNKYTFYNDVPSTYHLNYQFQSKKALDNADINSYFILLANNNVALKQVYTKLKSNRERYAAYLRDYEQAWKIDNSYIDNLDLNARKFENIEERICKMMIRQPVMDISIDIRLEYTSPKGQKAYYKSSKAHYNNLDNAYKEAQRMIVRKMMAEAERAKMSAGLRYEILRRDGFRCTICGAEQKDGVKLHVDHIIPVSRGGQTVASNLRTLCDRCNLGKSDKYREGSLN